MAGRQLLPACVVGAPMLGMVSPLLDPDLFRPCLLSQMVPWQADLRHRMQMSSQANAGQILPGLQPPAFRISAGKRELSKVPNAPHHVLLAKSAGFNSPGVRVGHACRETPTCHNNEGSHRQTSNRESSC